MLPDFSTMNLLKILFLDQNKISEFNEIFNLKNCTNLEQLSLSYNPIESKTEDFRAKVILMLP